MKLRTSITAKIIAWILIAVSGLGLVGSGILAFGMEEAGFYDRTYAEIRKEQFETYSDRYSARVLEYLGAKKNTNQEYFKNRNFKYGVVQADFLSEIESLDLNNENNYIDTNFDFKEELKLEDLHVFQCTIGEHTRFVSDNPDSLWGYYWIQNTPDAWNTYDIVSDSYFVLSYQEDGFTYIGDLFLGTNDVFGAFDMIVGTLYSMRYQVFGIFFGCLAVFLAAFVFLCSAAGYRKGQAGLVEIGMNRIPFEIYAGIACLVEVVCILAFVRAYDEMRSLGDIFWIVIMVMAVLLGGLSAVAAVLEVITRLKLRILWKNTICYWVISKLLGGCKQTVEFAAEHTSLAWKAVLLAGGNVVLDFMILLMSHELGSWFLFFLLKGGLILLLALGTVSQLKRLKDAGEHMAKGDLAYRVDTNGMFWEFKKHGEHLNSVGEGLAIAVEERMKSEHFKTELITNVSHDIKTPLTSIINYVDLMQKETVSNPKLEEYLEVLDRQSKRLKKLLEDLLEASKASAGTLQVDLEVLEAGVFMVQTVGEFEEKTKALDLELIIKKPEEPVYIRADGRHFWRVIDNLINNICKYAQPNTRVYINLEATKEKVCITFRNTSRYPLNITSEELKERFVRGDESRHTEGSGLGLSIAQSLMELMHGSFELVVDGDLFKVILLFDRILN